MYNDVCETALEVYQNKEEMEKDNCNKWTTTWMQ